MAKKNKVKYQDGGMVPEFDASKRSARQEAKDKIYNLSMYGSMLPSNSFEKGGEVDEYIIDNVADQTEEYVEKEDIDTEDIELETPVEDELE